MRRTNGDAVAYDEPELVARLVDGDEYAFAALFDHYHDLLLAFAYKRLHNEDDAKDVVQDVYVRLWKNRESFRLETNLENYLFKAVFNSVLNVFKHRSVHALHLEALAQALPNVVEGTDHGIRERDMASIIAMEVAALPPKMREAFELRWKEGLTNKQIALRMGLSEQTVETHMKRTLRVLRGRLQVAIPFFL